MDVKNINNNHKGGRTQHSHAYGQTVPNRGNLINFLSIIIDLLLVVASYNIAFLARFSGKPPIINTMPFFAALPLLLVAFLIYADLFGLMKLQLKSRRDVISSIAKLVFTQTLTTTTIVYFMQGFSFPRLVLIIAAAVQFALLSAWNLAMLSLRDRVKCTTYAMVVGDPENVDIITGKLQKLLAYEKIELKYFFKPEDKNTYINIIKKSRVDEVVLCSELSEDLKMEILLICINHGISVYLVPEVFEIALLNTKVIHLDDTPLLQLDQLNLSFEQRLFKRLFDLAITVAALPVLLPFLLAVALGVKVTSPGRILYSQERVTGGGKVYNIYKFRTMCEDAERNTGPVVSSAGDERVTPFGRFLRRYRIDEFPQLINVLKGDMSLVGPRSERPYFVEKFNRDINGYGIRNNVKAGLTGYAQIFGHYGTGADLKLKYDILYIRNYSMLLDIKILLQTFNAVLKKGSS